MLLARGVVDSGQATASFQIAEKLTFRFLV